MDTQRKTIKLLISVQPKPLKLLLPFEHGTLISQVKQKVNDVLLNLKVQHICDRLLNEKEYMLDDDSVRRINNLIFLFNCYLILNINKRE